MRIASLLIGSVVAAVMCILVTVWSFVIAICLTFPEPFPEVGAAVAILGLWKFCLDPFVLFLELPQRGLQKDAWRSRLQDKDMRERVAMLRGPVDTYYAPVAKPVAITFAIGLACILAWNWFLSREVIYAILTGECIALAIIANRAKVLPTR